MLRTESVRQNVADNLRRQFSIPRTVADWTLLTLYRALSDLDSDQFTEAITTELARNKGDWPRTIHALVG